MTTVSGKTKREQRAIAVPVFILNPDYSLASFAESFNARQSQKEDSPDPHCMKFS